LRLDRDHELESAGAGPRLEDTDAENGGGLLAPPSLLPSTSTATSWGARRPGVLGIRVFQTRSGSSAFELVVSIPTSNGRKKPTFTDCKEVKIEVGRPRKLKKVFDARSCLAHRSWSAPGRPSWPARNGPLARLMRTKRTKTYANASPSRLRASDRFGSTV